ncbi:serine hydrolase domain-containing protein [Solibacillus sp. FSL K6-1523]|uniref:serine hydrolase domain-containing protein n=1 Tax=Solibacillus sp. FSL K6-1523 TaxID=2921471 RepID=UPI0030F86316
MEFQAVQKFIEQSIEQNVLPGAVLCIANRKDILFKKSFGKAHVKKDILMKENTLFDVASLTKVVATTPAILLLLEQGLLDLDDSIAHYFLELQGQHEEVTIKHLLTHTSGFQPEVRFYIEANVQKSPLEVIEQIQNRKAIGSEVIYSDVNYILLGMLVEKISGESLSSFTRKNIFQPLQMEHTLFNPSSDLQIQIAATEYRNHLQDYQWGDVHDENANYFGGVSGHAGLFSTAEDLARYAQAFMKGEPSILTEETKRMSKQTYTRELDEQRGLGWQVYSNPTFSGQYLQDGFGHTGFTGTSMWISDEQEIAIVLLTNRVHYGRQCNIQRFRRITHNLIALAVENSRK